MSGSANVSIGGYRKDQQMSGSANVQVESANGRLAEISKCLSQQMSKPSQLKSRQQKSVSKSPVGKCQIGKIPHTGAIYRHVKELQMKTSKRQKIERILRPPEFFDRRCSGCPCCPCAWGWHGLYGGPAPEQDRRRC